MLNQWLFTHAPRLRQVLTWLCYQYISYLDRNAELRCLNYGYAPAAGVRLALPPADEPSRHQLQLYHHVAGAVDWAGRAALEVSSGRGGGAHFVHRHFQPQTLIGVDFSPRAVAFCRRYYGRPGLSFVQGDAEALKFPDQHFDVVLNIEASLYYPRVERFFHEVRRVLRPGGYFLYADMRPTEALAGWRAQLAASGLAVVSEEDLTPAVVRAMQLDRARMQALVERRVPRLLRAPFLQLAGVQGGNLTTDTPAERRRRYLSFVLQKPPLTIRALNRRADAEVAA